MYRQLSNLKHSTVTNASYHWHYNYPRNSRGPYPIPADKHIEETKRTNKLRLTPRLLRSVWPRNFLPPTKLTEMNAEETAIWLEMLANFKGWMEGKAYAESFKRNGVTGPILPCLTLKALRYELDILKLGHRLEITGAISNNELTMLNPFVHSIRPVNFHMFADNPVQSDDSNIQWKKKWEKLKTHPADVSKLLSKNCWVSNTCGRGHFRKKSTMHYHADIADSPNFFVIPAVDETNDWMSNDSSSRKRKQLHDLKGNEQISRYNSKHLWIPPLELPPAVLKIEGRIENARGDKIGVTSPKEFDFFEINGTY